MTVDELFDDANGDLALGDLDAAVEKYRRCVEMQPDFADGWHALAMALMKTGRHEEAIPAAVRNTELRPNDQLAWSSLSICHVKNGQIKEAEAAGAKARILSWGWEDKEGRAGVRQRVQAEPDDERHSRRERHPCKGRKW